MGLGKETIPQNFAHMLMPLDPGIFVIILPCIAFGYPVQYEAQHHGSLRSPYPYQQASLAVNPVKEVARVSWYYVTYYSQRHWFHFVRSISSVYPSASSDRSAQHR